MHAGFTDRVKGAKTLRLGFMVALGPLLFPGLTRAQAPTLDFETGDMRGWVVTGNAFQCQPTRVDNPILRGAVPPGHQGNYWVGTYGCRGPGTGDRLQGAATYGPFQIRAGTLSFLIGGSSSPETRVELLVYDQIEQRQVSVLKTSGPGTEAMQRVTWDLKPYMGKTGWIRLMDESYQPGGHLTVDDFRFAAEGQAKPRTHTSLAQVPRLQVPEFIKPFANLLPTPSSISPATVDAGSPDTTLTVTGTSFTPESTVQLSGTSLDTSFVSSTQLRAVAPAAQLTTAGSYPVRVVTPTPRGGTSDAVNLTVRVVVAVSPSTQTVQVTQTQQFTATVTGSGNQGVSWSVNDVAGGNSTLGTIDVRGIYTTPAIPPTPHTVTVKAASVEYPWRTASAAVTVVNPAPSLRSIFPTVVDAGSPDMTLTVTGASFTPESTVQLSGASLATSPVSSNQLTAVAPAAQLTTAGSYPLRVVTPSPGGGTSDAVNLTVIQIEWSLGPIIVAGLIVGVAVLLGAGYYTTEPKRRRARLKRAGISFVAVPSLGRQQLESPSSGNFATDVRLSIVSSKGEQTTEVAGSLVTGEEVLNE